MEFEVNSPKKKITGNIDYCRPSSLKDQASLDTLNILSHEQSQEIRCQACGKLLRSREISSDPAMDTLKETGELFEFCNVTYCETCYAMILTSFIQLDEETENM